MESEARLQWLETRIVSSCKPRADDLRKIFTKDESRATFLEFFSNNDAHRLFVYFANEEGNAGSGLKVSLSPPVFFRDKCICFIKTGPASLLHSGNLDDSITCMDWSDPLTHGDTLLSTNYMISSLARLAVKLNLPVHRKDSLPFCMLRCIRLFTVYRTSKVMSDGVTFPTSQEFDCFIWKSKGYLDRSRYSWEKQLSHSGSLKPQIIYNQEVFLPLLCTDQEMANQQNDDSVTITQDKLMDLLHRLLVTIEITKGTSEGLVCLPIPSIEVLAEAAAYQHRQPAVVHVLESAVIGWIKQIRSILRHDPLASTRVISRESKEPVRPHHEVAMWEQHIKHLQSILLQLEAPVAKDILVNLTHANSSYAQSFGTVQAEVQDALKTAKARLRCFTTVQPWIQDIYRTSSLERMLKVFSPLLHTIMLMWRHSDYYHNSKVFAHLLQMLSNEVVARARSLVGEHPFEDTSKSYTALKDALRLCASFRGTYLDFKEAANAINEEKLESNVVSMARLRPKDHNILFRAKMYGPTGFHQLPGDTTVNSQGSEENWQDSPWPPRNVACFSGLSRFVERCNDLLDLVETTRHFHTLKEASKVGGAGSRALDALVNDIHQVFTKTIQEFTKKNQDVLTIDDKQHFEKAFFHYRFVIKTLERRLAGVLRKSISVCPSPMSHLRVLEVFEGISARDLLQKDLTPENEHLISQLIEEFKNVKSLFQLNMRNIPKHTNMPPTVCKLFWVRGLKDRISVPMNKIRQVCPHTLESDKGWMLRDAYTEIMNDLEKYENKLLLSWSRTINTETRELLKNFVLAQEDGSKRNILSHRDPIENDQDNDGGDGQSPRERSMSIKVNLDQKLLEMLRDIKYLQMAPYEVPIPQTVRALLRSVDSSVLHRQATRLRTVVSKYNHIVKSLKQHELLLFEGKLRKVDELIQQGKEIITWSSTDLQDYIEKVTAVISDDVYRCLTRVHNNWAKVEDITRSWSEGDLDIFTCHRLNQSTHNLDELLQIQEDMDQQYKNMLIPSGEDIHSLLKDSFQTIEMSAASPAWRLYTAQMDAVVLLALKKSIVTSLDAMYLITSAVNEDHEYQPILTIRLELVEQTVSFSPPMDRSSSVNNVDDAVESWLAKYVNRADLVRRLTDPSNTYDDFLKEDDEVIEVIAEIKQNVMENAMRCKESLSIFDNYKFLWVQDVQQSFQDFLNGRPSPNPLRASKLSQHRTLKTTSQITTGTGQRSRYSVPSPDAVTEAERAFLTPHRNAVRTGSVVTGGQRSHAENQMRFGSSSDTGMEFAVPGLAEFDEEISIYKSARDDIARLPDHEVVGWLNINFEPIKQVLTTYASKWMWTFTKFLSDQVTDSLDTLANFLARTEPEIESITGEERDTASFMKMMRLFNEVSAQQQDMDERFAVMHRTVRLLERYDMKLSNDIQQMFNSAPDRWNHLKTKVSLAKQRLGPRIQEESARITRDLLRFGERVSLLSSELRSSEVFSRECPIHTAMEAIDGFTRRLRLLQTEAQDLIELQELLEAAVVNFSILPQYQRDLKNLKITWEQKRSCEAEQRDWKMKHWQNIDTKHLQQAIKRQKEMIQSLPQEVCAWDVYHGLLESTTIIEQCLPLVEDLNHPAMRTRHWKQLVRVTGGLLQTDTDSLRKMILGDLLELGLQKHGEEVKAIVQRAIKDLTIESSLKTCEEVWLGKVFDLQPHTGGVQRAPSTDLEAGSEIAGSDMLPHAVLQQTYEGSRTTGGTRTKSMKSGPHSKSSDKTGPGSVSRGRGGGRTSVLSLPISLVNLVDDPSPICLLKSVEKIFSGLEHHQMELYRMQSNSAIGSFLDEVTKWQKKLQLIEAVLEVWIRVQEKWVQLEDIYSGADVRTALAHEANMFAVISKDFRLIMRATEKNTNVLQSCSRKGLLPLLEKMDVKMDQCKHALLGNLERRRQRFPRFYFLSPEDVMNIVCYGYDLNAVNKYLYKILPNLGKLDFEEQEIQTVNASRNRLMVPNAPSSKQSSDKKNYMVNGVISLVGEKLELDKPLSYQGPMSQWLPQLIESIKCTLQEKLHVALGFEPRPAQIERDLRSAGASKVRVSRPSSAASHHSGSNSSVKPSELAQKLQSVKEGPSEVATQLIEKLSSVVSPDDIKWTVDNCTQVTLLATSVQMSDNLSKAVQSQDQANSMKNLLKKILIKLDGAIIMLKGLGDEKLSRLKSAQVKVEEARKKILAMQGANRGDMSVSDSRGAPSTRSLLEDDMDIGGDEMSMDDGISDAAPINTMQSLLFTEQIQSGGKAARRDMLEVDLKEILPEEDTEQPTVVPDVKHVLLPSQMQKITNLVMILGQYRDFCSVLMEKPELGDQSFDYLASIKHHYNETQMEVSAHVLDWEFDYGFEYQGSCRRFLISPSCDRVILSMCHALNTKSGVMLSQNSGLDSNTVSSEIVTELANQFGRALYTVVSTSFLDHFMLGDLFKGLAETGCWLCMENINNLSLEVLSVATQLIGKVLDALRSGLASLELQGEDVSVVQTAAFFTTLHGRDVGCGEIFMPLQTAVGSLPENFLKKFRIVNGIAPDRTQVLEIQLLAQGFTQASNIARKIHVLLDLIHGLFPSDTGKISQHNQNGSFAIQNIEQIIFSAGAELDELIHVQAEQKRAYKEMMANKTKKFAELWKYNSLSEGSRSKLLTDTSDLPDGESSDEKPLSISENDKSILEEDIEALKKLEEEVVVSAVWKYTNPRLPLLHDRNAFITLVQDLFPNVDVDFGDDAEEGDAADQWGEEINTEVSIPVQPDTMDIGQPKLDMTEVTNERDRSIRNSMSDMKLCHAPSFMTCVNQLFDIFCYTKGVIVTGRSGSGKSTCINVFMDAQKKMGVEAMYEKIFVNALDSPQQLFGFYDTENREWKDGLIQHLMRPHCFSSATPEGTHQRGLVLQVDGMLDVGNSDLLLQLVQSSRLFGTADDSIQSDLILPNNERLRLAVGMQVIWELESLSHLAPNVVTEVGLLVMGSKEVTWKVHLSRWMEQLPEAMQENLNEVLDKYFPKITSYFSRATRPSHLMRGQMEKSHILTQAVRVSVESMTITFCHLLNCLLTTSNDLNVSECERYVGYAVFWAFGGTLEYESRSKFVIWWKEQWPTFFPKHYNPWYVFVDADTKEFAHWPDHLPQFSGFAHSGGHLGGSSSGLPSQDEQQRLLQQDEVFVHTPESVQMNHILGLLTDASRPVMIIGPTGCGKTALVRERVNNVSSGEVAEVLSLFINCNRLTQASGLWDRMSTYLEWKHSNTYSPRGNKKLLCVVDDVNLSKPMRSGFNGEIQLQSSCEIIRQHLDIGGVRNIRTFKWQQVSNVTYIATANPSLSCSSCPLTQRFIRLFSMFALPFPPVEAQKSIFSAMLGSHFLHTYGSSTLSSSNLAEIWAEKPLENLLQHITMVTIELQDRLRQMYLSIPERAHYLFTLNDLDRIFRNLLLSLRKDCHHKDLLLLWRHECDWAYGWRMISDVDLERYHQAFDTAVRKHLTENKYLPHVVPIRQPLFSNIRELDSGFVTAGRYQGRTSQSSSLGLKSSSHKDVGDYYKQVADAREVRRLLTEAVKEYNKVNVGMNLSLYNDAITLVCRLVRIMQSPHKTGHTLLFGDGAPMISRLLVNLAAHLGGFNVRSLRPVVANNEEEAIDSDEARLVQFKEFMVSLYNQTGVKGEKVVLFLSDDRILTHECLAVLDELIRHGAISHLFTNDEQTTIANSVRSEVTAAGLTYSRDAAWNFFQSTVMKNLRIILVCSETGKSFMAKSLEFPSLFNHFNMIAMRPWSHEQLVEVTLYHISHTDANSRKKCSLLGEQEKNTASAAAGRPLDKKWMENTAHLLANMHIAVRQKPENDNYKVFGHVSNYAFEKLVQRFVSIYSLRRQSVHECQDMTSKALMNIDKENAIAESLQKELNREKQVLEEHKIGTIQLLAQIGQDMVITEQQVMAVKQQIRKIRHLKKYQPKYKHAHEKAVFKAAASVKDTKKIVNEIDHQALAELRLVQKPDNDVEDLMACIIMILKTPNSDLTWSKGAKRQMANLDRFIDELMNFDINPLPQSTLDALEPTLEKETFTPDNLTEKAGGNSAVGELLKWVQGVVKYNGLMIAKVKPLHDKLEETSSAIVGAQYRLRQLESKKQALESRLRDLAEGFEQATVDKNEQENKRIEMQEHLQEAAYYRQVFAEERERRMTVAEAYHDQLDWVTGVAAVSAGFVTYMGPYPYMFRRMLLTVDWAQCLAERGIPLVFDTIDPVNGHQVEFMLDVNGSIAEILEGDDPEEGTERSTLEKVNEEVEPEAEDGSNMEENKDDQSKSKDSEDEKSNSIPPPEGEKSEEEKDETNQSESKFEMARSHHSDNNEDEKATTRATSTVPILAHTCSSMPYMSVEEYQVFMTCIIKVLVGEESVQEWMTKEYSHHRMENAAILHTSWQRPPLLMDPYLSGVEWYAAMLCNDKRIVPVNLSPKTGQSQIMVMEKAIISGHTLMLMDCEQQPGNFLRPLIYHANTRRVVGESLIEETRTVRWLGRRLLCPDSFRLCMSTAQPASALHSNIIAASQLISYIPSVETLQEDLQNRALAQMRPSLAAERKQIMRAIRQHKRTLSQLDDILTKKLITDKEGSHKELENSTKFISSIVHIKAQVFAELKTIESLLASLNSLAEGLLPIARRSALLYSICRALTALDVHYQIPLPFFQHLFDSAVGVESMENGDDEVPLADIKIVKPFRDELSAPDDSEDTLSQSQAQERRRSRLRLGSATKAVKKAFDNGKTSDGDQLKDSYEGERSLAKTGSEEEDSEGEMVKKQSQYEIVVPTIPELPSMDYPEFETNEVEKVVEAITARVFEYMYHSVQPEHRLHVTILTLLSVQLDSLQKRAVTDENNDESTQQQITFTEDELTLLFHENPGFGGGMGLALEDFDSKAAVPSWIPADLWEDIIAFSVLPGLEGLCVEIAERSDVWKEWYDSLTPQMEDIPNIYTDGDSENSKQPLSNFYKLLLVRTLRPDRLQSSMESYIANNSEGSCIKNVLDLKSSLDRDLIFKDIANTLGILLILPDVQDAEIQAKMPLDPIDAIKKLSESCHVNLTVVTIGKGCLPEVTQAIDQAHADDSWLVINGLHLAPKKFFEDLQLHLARIGNISQQSGILNGPESSDVTGDEKPPARTPKFLVWLTTRPSSTVPSTLTQYLYKLSWKSLIDLVSETSDEGNGEWPIFKTSMVQVVEKIPEDLFTYVLQSPHASMELMYALCACHCLLLCWQCYGWHGSTRRYALTDSVLAQAMTYIVTETEKAHCVTLIKNLYSNIITYPQDKAFFERILDDVLSQVVDQKASVLVINGAQIPIPSGNLSQTDLQKWMMTEILNDIDMTSLTSIHKLGMEWKTEIGTGEFLKQLQKIYTSLHQPGYDTSVAVYDSLSQKHSISLSSIQIALELCSEQLPPLLELGIAQHDSLLDYDFPYHRPSVLSEGLPSSVPFPESISFVLMKECTWFNSMLCHVHQHLHDLKVTLGFSSDYKLPCDLAETARSLLAGDVPPSWLHPNERPSSDTLLTWLSDVNRRYKQFRSWVREGLVPIGTNTPTGKLSSVWLGGLVNPNALLRALCHEKAVAQDTPTEKIYLKCKELSDESEVFEQESGFLVNSLHIINSSWDLSRGFVTDRSDEELSCELPTMYLYADVGSKDDENDNHHFPLYMSSSRQAYVNSVPLPVNPACFNQSGEPNYDIMNASIVLRTGISPVKRDAFKTRAYLAKKRREIWNRVAPDVSDLMSRSATRLSSARQSLAGFPVGSVSGKADSVTGKPESIKSQSMLTVPKKASRKLSNSSYGDPLPVGIVAKAKSSSQASLSSRTSSMQPAKAHKPPSRVQEEREDRYEDENEKETPMRAKGNDDKFSAEEQSETNPPQAGAGEKGDLPEGFFDITPPPSTDASLLQSLMGDNEPPSTDQVRSDEAAEVGAGDAAEED